MLNDRLESMGFSADELGLTAPDNIPTPGSVEAPTSSSKEIMSIDDELAEIEKQLGK